MRIVVLLFALLLVGCQQSNLKKTQRRQLAIQRRSAQVIDSIRLSTVKIATRYGTGTGFYVSTEGHVITNFHVIEQAYKSQEQVMTLVALAPVNSPHVRFEGTFTMVPSTIVDVDSVHDLALLKLKQNPFKNELPPLFLVAGKSVPSPCRIPLFSTNQLYEGSQIAVSGYPLNIPVLITNSGTLSSLSGKNQYKAPDYGAGASIASNWDQTAYYADIQINHGNSGGPVYSLITGEIIGVAVAFIPAQAEQGYVTYNTATKKVLENLIANSTIPEIKQLLLFIAGLEYHSVANSGLAVIIPLEFVRRLVNKHGIFLR